MPKPLSSNTNTTLSPRWLALTVTTPSVRPSKACRYALLIRLITTWPSEPGWLWSTIPSGMACTTVWGKRRKLGVRECTISATAARRSKLRRCSLAWSAATCRKLPMSSCARCRFCCVRLAAPSSIVKKPLRSERLSEPASTSRCRSRACATTVPEAIRPLPIGVLSSWATLATSILSVALASLIARWTCDSCSSCSAVSNSSVRCCTRASKVLLRSRTCARAWRSSKWAPTRARTTAAFTGLEMKSTAPSSRPLDSWAGSLWAVTKITAMSWVAGSAFRRRQTS